VNPVNQEWEDPKNNLATAAQPKPMKGVSLYAIEQGLADLIAYRQERLADKEDPPQQDELDAIEGEIRKYQISEPAKVSGVVAIFRMWKAQIANAKEEIKRFREIVRALEANEARLKEHCAGALEVLPAPAKGKSRSLTGLDGSRLILKGNGGLEPLHVDGWDPDREEWSGRQVLPQEYALVTVTMPHDLAIKLLMDHDAIGVEHVRPNGELIRKTLATSCAACDGIGSYPEQNPAWMSAEALDAGATCEAKPCPHCNGTGRKLVPGARLLPRGSHVECR
jgi:hypothetical protein